MKKICDDWLYTDDLEKGFDNAERVRLPHNVGSLPLHYSSPSSYEKISAYQKTIKLEKKDLEKRIFLLFQGCAHISTLYFNSIEIGQHFCGYTSFRFEVTQYAKEGENTIQLILDSRENKEIPPFGFVIDYLTYGGIYRDVYLDMREKTYIDDVFVITESLTSLKAKYKIDGSDDYEISTTLLDGNNTVIIKESTKSDTLELKDLSVAPWSPSSPTLYTLRSSLIVGGKVLDTIDTVFGFRTVEIKGKDLLLNGEKIFLRGLNRHQSWPYIGYAAPDRMQREDARKLKYELGCNIVRTSHYPQSHSFISECDKIGLLVFTEIPGWQHVGDDNWQDIAIENTKDMVMQYRNHPSIIIWGVRINESMDYDDFYKKTNQLAHALDPSRPTSGVRYIENSSLLEDIYSYNDFSHTGNNSGVKKRSKVTKENKPLLVSEANGHMFPTKSFDSWERRQEHALRHARVLNDAMKDKEHIGCIQWCMFDYATHKDFGSGDRICYHGVMDSFRNPKSAAFLWASQGEGEVLHVSSSMDIGDYNGGIRGKVWVFTNAERIDVYKNGRKITSLDSSPFSSLLHGPIPFSDTIGNLLEIDEGYSRKKSELVKECLNAAVEFGFQNLPKKYLIKLGYCMLRYGLKFSDGVDLFGKYVSGWGGESTEWKFQGIWNGKEGKAVTISPSDELHLEIKRECTELFEGNGYDETLVRIRVLDKNGNIAPYVNLPLYLEDTGSVEILGPKNITLEGGMGGIIVRTKGVVGKGRIKISSSIEETEMEFNVKEYHEK